MFYKKNDESIEALVKGFRIGLYASKKKPTIKELWGILEGMSQLSLEVIKLIQQIEADEKG